MSAEMGGVEQGNLRATEAIKSRIMWDEVSLKIDEALKAKDLPMVAHSLACSWWGSDNPASADYNYSKEKAREMCIDPRLEPYREELWGLIQKANGDNWPHRDEAYRTFTEDYGWDI